MKMKFSALAILVVALSFSESLAKKIKEGECEVCVKFFEKFIAELDESEKGNQQAIEHKFKTTCKKARGKEERLCYYIGGLETSATYIVPEMSKPVSWGVPADKICEKLSSKDSQICELRLTIQKDISKLDLNKLKVKDLKQILSDWGEDCYGCTEKSEFVKRVKDLMPQYVKPDPSNPANNEL